MSRGISNAEDLSFIISFINSVENYPCLWNYDVKEYHKTDVVGLAWKTIAAELKDTEQNCRERWKNIRCAFVRSLKPSKSGPGNKRKKTYYLAEYLAFLIPYTKGSSMYSNLSVSLTQDSDSKVVDSEQNETQTIYENCELDVSKDTVTSAINTVHGKSSQLIEKMHPQKKKKLQSLHPKTFNTAADIAFMEWVNMKKLNQSKQEDSDLLFFRSLLPDFKKLDDRHKRIFKSKMMITLNDMLDEIEQDAPSTPYSTSIESTSSWVLPVNPSDISH